MNQDDTAEAEGSRGGDDEGNALYAGSFVGRERFRELVRNALSEAARRRWRDLVLADPDFQDWPLGERAVIESLTAWVLAGQRLTLLARRYDAVHRAHPRFVTWRRQWSHKIEARGVPSADPLEVPSLVWTPEWALQRIDVLRSTGYCGPEAERRTALREQLDDWLQRSSAAFPADTLGL